MSKLKDAALNQPQISGKARTIYKSRLHDVQNFHISLKQWRMLHAVIDCGGFTDAAESLHISQSAISYTIGKLQEQLGIPLLKVEGRKAHITEEGRALLHRSRNLIKEALEIEAFAENLRKGWGVDVRLVVDHNFPSDLLMLALRKFSFLECNIKVSLSEVTMAQAEKALCEHAADLAICGEVPLGVLGDPLIEVEYVAVANPSHSLFALGRTIIAADLERQVQIVICNLKDPSYSNNKSHSLGYFHRWNVSSFDSAVGALLEGLGYAWLPRHRIRKWLDQGKLAILPLNERRTYMMNFYLIHGRPWTPDSGADKLAEVLHSLASGDSDGATPCR
jgi:DNA-binding transcriptional LysR family regulator